MGRQPWVVLRPDCRPDAGVSPTRLARPSVLVTSMIVFTLLYACSPSSRSACSCRYAKAGPPELDRAGPTPTTTDAADDADASDLRRTDGAETDRWNCPRRLVHPHRRPVDRLLRPRGLRLRRRHAAARARPQRRRAPRADQHHRPGLGRQRGLAAHRRRRDVRRLPRVVRHPVLRLLPAAAAHPGRADRPRRRLRVPRQARPSRLAAPLGPARSSSARWSPRCCGASRSPTSCAACRSTPNTEYVGSFFDLLNPYALLGGLDHAGAVPHPRRDLPRAQDRRRDPRAGATRSPPEVGPGRRRRSPVAVPASGRWPRRGRRLDLGARRAAAAVALVGALAANRRGREGWAFIATGRDDRAGRRDAVRRALPERDAVHARPGVHPDRRPTRPPPRTR